MSPKGDQTLRINPEMEQQVLGAVLLDNPCFATVDALLRESDFGVPVHATIFRAMQSLVAREQPVDSITLSDELRVMERLQTVGGMQYLLELTEHTPSTAHLEAYCLRLATLGSARRAFGVARKIAQHFRDDSVRPEEVVERALAALSAITPPSADKLVTLSESLTAVMQSIESTADPTLARVSTGLRDLDELTAGGPAAGQLWILAARPAMGKTTAAMQMALAAARQGPVLFATIEMSHVELTTRALAGASGVEHDRLRRRQLDGQDWSQIIEQLPALESLPIHYLDVAELTLSRLRVQARALKAKGGLRVIIIDYLGKMRGEGEFDTRAEEISHLSGGLKALAKELGVPIIALAQLNRDCEKRTDKRPMPSDLRDGGSIEQDADVIAFLYRDWVYNKQTSHPDATEVIVGKQRDGAAETVYVLFERHLSRFRDADPDELEALRGNPNTTPPPRGARKEKQPKSYGSA